MKKNFNNNLLEVDAHVHTIASTHAYSTISECASEAKKKGIRGIVITDHFGPMFLNGSLFQHYAAIANMRHINSSYYGVNIISGVEIDIVDKEGNLAFYDTYFTFDQNKSVCNKLLDKVDVVIASCHELEYQYTYHENTEMLLKVLTNPKVNILGHCDRMKESFDVNCVLKLAKELNKIIELNSNSIDYTGKDNKRFMELAIKCAENNVMVSVGSDAHFAYEIGNFSIITKILQDINFPKQLIINTSLNKFINCISKT